MHLSRRDALRLIGLATASGSLYGGSGSQLQGSINQPTKILP